MRMPSLTRSLRWRISMRSVMPGMLRSSSLARIGFSESRQRIVPFHRPSMTDSMASMGHSEISFFETGMVWPDRGTRLTYLSVPLTESFYRRTESEAQELNMRPLLDIVTTVCIGLLIGTEFAVAVFINPILRKLGAREELRAIRLFAATLGSAMPIWYSLSFLLLITEAG